MNSFKEWLSDYLRYFLLLLAVLLAVGAIFLGVKLYQSTQTAAQDGGNAGDGKDIHILTETEQKTEENTKESETPESQEKETEAPGTESERRETEQTAAGEPQTETAVQNGSDKKAESVPAGTAQTEKRETEQKNPETNPPETNLPQTDSPQTEAPETNPPETDPPQPVYLTMTGACYIRSYADYGDNIIGEYPAGTVVEFLEDVGGWYKVQIDGMVGYMGARFFS